MIKDIVKYIYRKNRENFTVNCIILLCGFILMGYDKRKAKKNKWRVPESRMFFTAALGGSVGIWLGMQNFLKAYP